MAAKINLETGKIVGAKINSFAWFHEKGHIVYNNSHLGISRGYIKETLFILAVTFLIFSSIGFFAFFFKIISLFCILEYWIYYIAEELWCNKYAKEKVKGGKNGR